jgi:hypothetical protein
MELVIAHDLDHCATGCGRLLPFFERTVAKERAVPQLCWTCQREVVPPKEMLHRRVLARQATVVRLPQTSAGDPVA